MDLMIDTHILVWLTTHDRRLPALSRSRLVESENLKVSAATAWEYADLETRGRLPGALPFATVAEGLSFEILSLPVDTWRMAANLPEIHRDPIDRMVVAHAIAIGATLATADAKMRAYPVKTLW